MTMVPALTTLRLDYKDPLTDTFEAQPLLGAVLDLNDGRTFTLAAPDGFTLSAPRRTLVSVGNIGTQGEAVSRGVYQRNRTAWVKVMSCAPSQRTVRPISRSCSRPSTTVRK